MPKLYLKKKKSENISYGPGGLNSAQIKVYLETQENDNYIFQNFRLVTSEFRLLQYFTEEKFIGYYILEREISKYYAGDGERIVYRKKTYFHNLITVTFEKIDKTVKAPTELENIQFVVEAPIPATTGCLDCIYFRKKNRRCLYYQVLGMKIRKNCVDFKQKEVKRNGQKEEEFNSNTSQAGPSDGSPDNTNQAE
jgi:hypothetical protein